MKKIVISTVYQKFTSKQIYSASFSILIGSNGHQQHSSSCRCIKYEFCIKNLETVAMKTNRLFGNKKKLEKTGSFIFIFQKSAGPNLEHSRTVLNYIHMCEGRFFIQVKNILSGLEGWSSANAALEGIKRRCCNCGDRQRVPETYC